MLTAGFSCQPWSRLGDGRGKDDERSATLPKLLWAAHFLQCHSLLLECVVGASKDKWVRQQLGDFCKQTGYRCQETTLQLHSLLPAQRERWWCMLRAPIAGISPFPKLPVLNPAPVVGDLLPTTLQWSDQHEKELRLDTYETGKFVQFGGLNSELVNSSKPLKTALHGWGNQLSSCPCTCRDYPLSESRLSSKGLFGALYMVGGSINVFGQEVPCVRHAHPWEIAVLHGIPPNQQWEPLKLTMSALGQMAAPVQACWLASCYMEDVGFLMGTMPPSPEENLWGLFRDVYKGMVDSFPGSFDPGTVRDYFTRITDLLEHSRVARYPNVHQMPFQTFLPAPPVVTAEASGVDTLVLDSKHDLHDKLLLPTQETSVKRRRVGYADNGGLAAFANVVAIDDEPFTFTQVAIAHFAEEDAADANIERTDRDMPRAGNGSDADLPDPHTAMPHDMRGALGDTPAPPGPLVVPSVNGSDADTPDPHAVPVTMTGSAGDTTPPCPTEVPDVTQDVSDAASPETSAPPPLPADRNHHDMLRRVDGVHRAAQEPVETHQVVLVRDGSLAPQLIRVKTTATVGSITVAEERLGSLINPIKIIDLVGSPLQLGDCTTPMQVINLVPVDDDDLHDHIPCRLCFDSMVDRVHLLYLQRQWVANDEFNFYLKLIQSTGLTSCVDTHVIPSDQDDHEMHDELRRWMSQCMYGAVTNRQAVSAMVVQGHWFPLVVTQHATGISVFTTIEGKPWVQAAIPDDRSIHIIESPLPQGFTADCGFQSVAWIVNKIMDGQTAANLTCPMHITHALKWRSLFVESLLRTDAPMVRPTDLAFGGMGGFEVNESLQKLLLEHGVPPDEVGKRADAILSSLGRPQVISALRGPRGWRDLKTLANQASPKFQLVLSHELSAAIQAKAPGRKFGDKKQKVKSPAARPSLKLTPADVQVPEGIFRDHDGQLVSQLSLQQINTEATGVVVVSMHDALPYVQRSAKVSTRALALVIIDPSDAMVGQVGDPVRLPARCVHNQEPILISCRLLQIGTGTIERHLPQNAVKVEEVPNCVIRVVVYRDELEMSWDTFIQRPVKEIMSLLPELRGLETAKSLLDCWDRQFLTLRMQRCRPIEAEQFIVTFRIESSDIKGLLNLSGRHGAYLEPREEDGRSPSGKYRVVWLNKLSRSDALLALQSTKAWACLVRTGTRFGLRVHEGDASGVHTQHKDTPYLDTAKVAYYTGGPFPWGATRSTLVKLFAQHLRGVTVTDSVFADHAILSGTFAGLGSPEPIPIWRKPLELPWDQVKGPLPAPQVVRDGDDPFLQIFDDVEHAVDDHLRLNDKIALLPQQFGRCATTGPTWKHNPVTPLRKPRQHDVQVTYLGENFMHSQWCRQLRRLQSYCRASKAASHQVHDQNVRDLWRSIRSAKGFPQGFPTAWKHRSFRSPGCPPVLPVAPPSSQDADRIFHDFQVEFRQLETLLNNKRLKAAKARRVENPNLVYGDVRKPRSLPAQTVVTKTIAHVTEVDVPRRMIKYEPAILDTTTPVSCEQGLMMVDEHSSGELLLTTPPTLAIGDPVFQDKYVGSLQGVFDAFRAISCGFPEGDALSVLSMALIKVAFHAITNQNISPGWVYSYVDNWEMITADVHQVAIAEREFQRFANLTCLQLDAKKTYAWSVTGPGRHQLRQAGFTVKLDSRDLGGHLHYSLRHTVYTIVARIRSCHDLWTWLRRSPAPIAQKLRVIRTVAWTKCLYGACTVRLGGDHFTKLRAAAMFSLNWNKKGASSVLQFGLVQHCQMDPEAVVTWDTLRAFRQHADHAVAFPLLDDLCCCPPKRYHPGPCAVLLERLHGLRWTWQGNGFIQDHWHCTWHLIDVPIQLLSMKFAQAWSARVGQLVHTRDTFEGLQHVDRAFTMERQPRWTDEQAALMRTSMNGTFYTRDKQRHNGKVASDDCPWCSQPDSLTHRLWECPGFQDERNLIPREAQEQLREMPPCTHLHGWFPEIPAVVQFAQAIASHAPHVECEPLPTCSGTMQIFVDGACQRPTTPSLRLATWAVVAADFDDDSFRPIGSGVLPGPLHSALRAEIFAAIVAIEHATARGKPFMLWTDNQVVHDRIHGWLLHRGKRVTTLGKNHDLWIRLRRAVHLAMHHQTLLHVIKIRSHEDEQAYSDHVEAWAIQGNHAVDRLAEQAFQCAPPAILTPWQHACKQHDDMAVLRDHMHTLLFRIGTKAVSCKQEILNQDQLQMAAAFDRPSAVDPRVSMSPLPDSILHVTCKSLEPHKDDVFRWLQFVQTGDQVVNRWMCGQQLLAHFQYHTGKHGYEYKSQKYVQLDPHHDYPFSKCAAWFCSLLKALGRYAGWPIVTERRPPDGSSYRMWQMCLLLPVDRGVLSKVDELFAQEGVTPVVTAAGSFGCPRFFGR
eukprot:Skav211128  [mRNA]  locus=scaffold1786:9514:17345:+ [translate_table: standard]